MARETKIGLALMVLLVGVFGFLVYKKWNGRLPIASVAAASDESGAKMPDAGKTDSAPSGTKTPSPIDAAPIEENPFASAASDVGSTRPPAGQAEPGTSVASVAQPGQSIPIRQSSAAASKSSPAEVPAVEQAEPFAQVEPAVGQSEPVDDGEFEPAEKLASGQPFSRSTTGIVASSDAAAQSSPAAADEDPFGNSVGEEEATDSAAATGSGTAAAVATTASTEDPFGGMGPSSAESTASDDTDPFSESVETETAQIETDEAETEAATSEPAKTETANTETSVVVDSDADPFGKVAEPAAKVEGATAATEPMKAAGEDPFGSAEESDASETVGSKVTTEVAGGELTQPETASPPGEFFPDAMAGEVEQTASAPQIEFEPVVTDSGAQPSSETPTAEPFEQSTPAEQPSEQRTPAANRSDYYVVQENDTYWTISKHVYGTSAYAHALAKANERRIADPKRMRPGMKVLTPSPEQLTAAYPAFITRVGSGTAQSEEGPTGLFTDQGGRPAYRVGPDDTLGKIAQAHLGRASRWVQIYEMNRDVVPNPKTLKPGTVLKLPKDASRVRLVQNR